MGERAQGELGVAGGLIQLTYVIQGIYARVAAKHDLTPVQAKLLCILIGGPRGMAELAQSLGVEKAALTGLIDRVERRGFARRTPVPEDRRALRVTLTEAGGRAAAAFHADVGVELSELVAPLAADQRESFGNAVAEVLSACRSRCSGDYRPASSSLSK